MNPLLIGYDACGRPIRIHPEDRKIHTHVVGASGGGKSKFLEWMIRGDLKNRQGFCLLDPHGTLYDDVVKYCARFPAEVPKDIILLNLSAGDQVVGFNPFRKTAAGNVAVQIDRRIAATMHAWNAQNTDQSPTLERMLRLVYAVMIEKNLGLPQGRHLIDFDARDIRAWLTGDLGIPFIEQEWQELQDLKRKDWRDETLSLRNRLARFLTSPALMRFMGLPDRTLDLKAVMDEGKVLLVNLAPSDDLSEENGRVFGALLVNEFFECARRRQKDPLGRDPQPYYLYMDEFQNFVSLDIVKMLAEVRKFGLFLVLAHQYLEQLDEKLMAAVLTNCQIKAVFGGLNAPSARMMAEEIFIRKLDPRKLKVAIYQTKFWPKEETRQVHTRSTSHSSATGQNESSAAISSISHGTGEFFGADQWFGSPTSFGRSTADASGSTSMSGSGSSSSEGFGEGSSVADIPVFVPVPFQELSSIQYYSLDEQLTEFTAALKEQYARHCFVKLPGDDAEPMLVPKVEQFYIAESHLLAYINRLFLKNNALPAPVVDRLLIEQETAFIQAARSRFGASHPAESGRAEHGDSELSDMVGDSPIWKRVSRPQEVPTNERLIETTIPPTARRKPGPKPDLSNHAKVAAIVAKHGDCWDSDENLPEVCEELDSAGIPPSTEWATLKLPALSWGRACQLYRDRVIKAIVYRRDHAPGDQI
jgi:hypothetical protein